MILHPEDRHAVENLHLRDGKGVVLIENLIEKDVFAGSGRLFALNTIKPGCSIGDHPHIGETEIYYITTGEGVYSDNGTPVHVKAGDICIAADGQHHAIENTGKNDLVFIALIVFTKK